MYFCVLKGYVMAVFHIADLNINIDDKFKYANAFCNDYLAENQNDFDFSAIPTKQECESVRNLFPNSPESGLESLYIYKSISKNIIDFDGFVLHASIIEKDGFAYAFSANSGVGKTTHSKLWLKAFDDARIINGDKPLVRLVGDNVFAYGTPWCGKERYNINTKGELKALCFIERGEKNSIARISKTEAVKRIYPQLLIPESSEYILKLLDLVEKFIDKIPAYVLKCNISEEAAIVAYNAMSQEL